MEILLHQRVGILADGFNQVMSCSRGCGELILRNVADVEGRAERLPVVIDRAHLQKIDQPDEVVPRPDR